MRRPPGARLRARWRRVLGAVEGRHAACPARTGITPDLIVGTSIETPSMALSRPSRPWGHRATGGTVAGRCLDPRGLRRQAGHADAAGFSVTAPMSSRRSRCENGWDSRNSVVLDSRTFRCTSSVARRASSALPATGSPVALSRRRSWRRRQSPGSSRRRRSTESASSTGASSIRCRWDDRRTRSTGRLRAPVGRVERPLSRAGGSDRGGRVSFGSHDATVSTARWPGCPGCAPWVLPSGAGSSRDDSFTAFRGFDAVRTRITASYAASRDFLAGRHLAVDDHG